MPLFAADAVSYAIVAALLCAAPPLLFSLLFSFSLFIIAIIFAIMPLFRHYFHYFRFRHWCHFDYFHYFHYFLFASFWRWYWCHYFRRHAATPLFADDASFWCPLLILYFRHFTLPFSFSSSRHCAAARGDARTPLLPAPPGLAFCDISIRWWQLSPYFCRQRSQRCQRFRHDAYALRWIRFRCWLYFRCHAARRRYAMLMLIAAATLYDLPFSPAFMPRRHISLSFRLAISIISLILFFFRLFSSFRLYATLSLSPFHFDIDYAAAISCHFRRFADCRH